MKQYKKKLPEQTIYEIRNILYEINLLLCEKHILQEGRTSCRVFIANRGLISLNIGTNGKGRSFEYSLASGYAEFMERLQNNIIISPKKIVLGKIFDYNSFFSRDPLAYSYDIKEKEYIPDTSNADIWEELKKFCISMCDTDFKQLLLELNEHQHFTAVPFYSVFGKKEVFLPIEYLLTMTTSNGMASGNSPQEAILQAICEIFERYVISEIYWKQLTPPTIPLEEFEGTYIYEQICNFKNHNNIDVIIKDCSLGCGIPAIGMILIDKIKHLYNFKIGVDFSSSIALERCFTEIHQGAIDFHGLPFTFVSKSYLQDKEKAESNFIHILVNGTGFWPESIMYNKSTYQFSGFNKGLGLSNREDLKYSFDLIKNLGYNIFIRNNSILGFSTFYVVIPGMSQILKRSISSLMMQSDILKKLGTINNFGRLNVKMAKDFFLTIDRNYEYVKERGFKLNKIIIFNINKDLNQLNLDLLLSMLAYYIGEISKSFDYLQLYLVGKNKLAYAYFYACLDYLALRLAENSNDDILSMLQKLYGYKIAIEVMNDFEHPNKIFQYYKFPNCPYCDKCEIVMDCKMKEISEINTVIKEKASMNPINQLDLRMILENVDD